MSIISVVAWPSSEATVESTGLFEDTCCAKVVRSRGRDSRRGSPGIGHSTAHVVSSRPDAVHRRYALANARRARRSRVSLFVLPNNRTFALGDTRHSPCVERNLVHIVETDAGQETLAPEAFAAKYGWKNDPERVRVNAP